MSNLSYVYMYVYFIALKRRRIDAESADEGGRYLVSLSPSACCVAVANGNSISFYQAGKVVLGLKGTRSSYFFLSPSCSTFAHTQFV